MENLISFVFSRKLKWKMLEYNAYLLNEIEDDENKEVNAADKKGELLELLKSMSEEERAALMEEASK